LYHTLSFKKDITRTRIPWDKFFVPSHPVGSRGHPIPSHGTFQKNKLSHGMGWDGIVPSHSEPWLTHPHTRL
jgi:hypothetical protein